MATPSSSATSESPPMAHLQPNTIVTSTDSIGMEPVERERRKKAVQKFLARAEVSMITRGLRARLSYASYKATHNIPHISLRDLEAQSQNQATSPRPSSTKRKVGGSNYYNNPSTQGSGGGAPGSTSRRGAMAPPSLSASASRTYISGINGSINRSANATQSLYTSILSPPPLKQARTIHNPSDPPVPAPSRPAATPRSRRGSKSSDSRSVRSIAEGTRAQAKSRREEKGQDRRKDVRPKGKQKAQFSSPRSKESGEDVDMKAVATLTSLLLQSRPSISGSASSPRSVHSDTGSNHSYSHFAQSSTRTTTAATTAVNSAEPSFTFQNHRPSTPTSGQLSSRSKLGNVTPNASNLSHAPADSEAADHLLFLASSPSPARPTSTRDKDAKDMAAFRALSGGAGLRATGRVLFSGADAGSDTSRHLAKNSENSFSLSISSIGSEMTSEGLDGGITIEGSTDKSLSAGDDGPVASSVQTVFTPQQLLPPPPSPPVKAANSDSSFQTLIGNPWPSSFSSTDQKSTPQAPPTPSSAPFNFNDFINVSPSPAAASPRLAHVSGQLKSGLSSSLGAGVRRKLFDEDQSTNDSQQKTHGDLDMPAIDFEKTQGRALEDEFEAESQGRVGGLDAGINLVRI